MVSCKSIISFVKKEKKEFIAAFLLLMISIPFFIMSMSGFIDSQNFVYLQEDLNISAPLNVIIDNNGTLHFDSMSLKQKIAQMVIVHGREDYNDEYQKLLIGGIYVVSAPSKNDAIRISTHFQNGSIIPMFVTTDLEGCWNPFLKFFKSPILSEIENASQAYQLGREHGRILNETGFNVNFAPVVDLNDKIWKCRSFPGTSEEITEKALSYIRGISEYGILTTTKHYPGKTLIDNDPHKNINHKNISNQDLYPFSISIENNVPGIMISHIIVNGTLDSEGKPTVVSEKILEELRGEYEGLIVTDEINMLGLKDYYDDIDQMYIDVFKADNDIILNFDYHIENIIHMISVVENAVSRGVISEDRIDDSVTRILKAKNINFI